MAQRKFMFKFGEDIPKEKYACIVGVYHHSTEKPIHYNPPNAHHFYIWVEIPATGNIYECAVHTRLTINSEMELCFFSEDCPEAEWPKLGISQVQPKLSYIEMGLKAEDFWTVGERSLPEMLRDIASHSARIEVYGFGHLKGNGLHDIHQNCGEPRKIVTRENHINQDGAIVFYFTEKPEIPAYRLFCCLKFEAQSLDRMVPLEGDEEPKD